MCAQHGYAYFHWQAGDHDLVRMASAAHLDSCDFTGATTLVPIGAPANEHGVTSYYLPCNLTAPGESLHLSCSVGTHCAQGQKLTLTVDPAHSVYADDGALLLHSDSLARVMILLGHRHEAATGFSYLERGFATEAAAEASLEMIWCLEAHCPASALDFLPGATAADCRAELYNLGGFVSRKRPSPQLAHAEAYYHTALAHVPSHCPTLGYLAELYLQTGNHTHAGATALSLCAACGGATSPAARQLRAAFAAHNASWACQPPSPPPPPLAPPPSPPAAYAVTFRATVAGSVEAFNGTAYRHALAAQLTGVEASQIELEVAAASVVVTATITAEREDVAAAVLHDLEILLLTPAANATNATNAANATSLSLALGVTVESATAPTVETRLLPSPPTQPPPPPPDAPPASPPSPQSSPASPKTATIHPPRCRRLPRRHRRRRRRRCSAWPPHRPRRRMAAARRAA